MALTLDLNDLAEDAGADVEEQIKKAVGRTVRAVKGAAEDTSRPDFVILHLVEQMASINERLVSGTYTGAGLDALVRKEPLALGGGDTPENTGSGLSPQAHKMLEELANASGRTVDEFVSDTHQGFAAAIKAGPDQAKARMSVSNDIIRGTIRVGDDKKLELQDKLDTANQELGKYTKFAALKTIVEDLSKMPQAERDAVLIAFGNLANGVVRVAPNGAIIANTPDPALVAERNDLVKERDKLNGIVANIKAHVEEKGIIGLKHHELDVDGLSDEAKQALGVN